MANGGVAFDIYDPISVIPVVETVYIFYYEWQWNKIYGVGGCRISPLPIIISYQICLRSGVKTFLFGRGTYIVKEPVFPLTTLRILSTLVKCVHMSLFG